MSDAAPSPAPPIRTLVRTAVAEAWDRAIAAGALPPLDAAARPPVEVERPANVDHGDFATSIALKLARPYRRAPLQIAEAFALALEDATTPDGLPFFASVTVAPPG